MCVCVRVCVLVSGGVHAHVCAPGECRRLVAAGGAYLNGARVEDAARVVTGTDYGEGAMCILRSGKKTHAIVVIGAE